MKKESKILPAGQIPLAVAGARIAHEQDDEAEWLKFVFGQEADPAAVARVDASMAGDKSE